MIQIYDIPEEYRGKGFLLARVPYKGGDISLSIMKQNKEDNGYRCGVEVTCGACDHTYDDYADIDDIHADLSNSKCPLCSFDNSGKATNVPGTETYN